MKKLHAAALASLLIFTSTAFAQSPKEAADARLAAERWMKLMDAEEYSAAWNAGATSMRKDLPKFAWNMLASTVRLPLGAVKTRTFKSSDLNVATAEKPATITLTFAGDYEKSPNVLEKVTTVQEADGQWRVSGFSINAESDKGTK
jgi:hypothetical protein